MQDWIPYQVVVLKYFIRKFVKQISADKVDANGWLHIHETAHRTGNA